MPGYTPIKTWEDGSGLYDDGAGGTLVYDPDTGEFTPWEGSTEFGGGGKRAPVAASEPDPTMLDVGGWDGMGMGRTTFKGGAGEAAPPQEANNPFAGIPRAPMSDTALGVYGQLDKLGKRQKNGDLRARAQSMIAPPEAAANPAQALLDGMAPTGLPGFPAEEPAGPQLPTVNHQPATPPQPPTQPGMAGGRRRVDRSAPYGSPAYGAQTPGAPMGGRYGSRALDVGRRLRGGY